MKIYKIKVNGKTYRVELEAVEETSSPKKEEPKKEEPKKEASTSGKGTDIVSPIQGTVVKVLVNVGDSVKKGTPVAIIEAMKLENEVVSTCEGKVTSIAVSKGQAISAKEKILTVE